MFETWFKDISAAKENYQNAKTEEEKGDARLVYHTISDQIKATDKITQRAFNDYEAFTTSYAGDTDEHENVPAVLFSLY